MVQKKRVMVQMNRMIGKGLQIRFKQLKKNNVLSYLKLYTQVHLVQVVYTSGFTEQKERIHMHTLSQEENHIWDGKLRKNNFKEYQEFIPWY